MSRNIFQMGLNWSMCRFGHIYTYVPDELYLKMKYWAVTGRDLNLDHPQTFSEKIQWLKLNDKNPLYTMMVDKIEVKKFIKNRIGQEYIIPTLSECENMDDIDFESLPNQFVLKCNHDSGGVVVVRDKNKINIEEIMKTMGRRLRSNYYYYGREWPYKDVIPRILIEQYMEDERIGDLRDYKIHCFDGTPSFIQVIGNRVLENKKAKQSFYDFKWKKIDLIFGDYPPYSYELEKPHNLEKMFLISSELSKNLKYVRVDLYEINERLYFGELTFYPNSGFYSYNSLFSYEDDLSLGNMIKL